jgi:outer membrane protein OmpA-like peptidoglycan-associated protein
MSLLAAAVISAGCATTPRVPYEVVALQNQLQDMRNDSRIAPHAAVELREAEQAVRVLVDNPRMPAKDFDQNLYLASRLVSIAGAEGLARHATQVGEQLDGERESMLLASRTREADQARMQAERERVRADEAQRSNWHAQSDAERARREAELAQRSNWDAQSDAERARREADQARLQAENERLGAERGLREAELARGDADAARREAEAAREALHRMEIELADLHAKQTERGLVVTVGDVLFEVDRAELRPGAQRELDKLAATLHDRAGFDLAIEGHTDSTGTAAHNQDLSERRAASVRNYLVAQGISRNRTSSIGLGQNHPVASNGHAAGRQQNRRVEIVIQQAQMSRVSEVGSD